MCVSNRSQEEWVSNRFLVIIASSIPGSFDSLHWSQADLRQDVQGVGGSSHSAWILQSPAQHFEDPGVRSVVCWSSMQQFHVDVQFPTSKMWRKWLHGRLDIWVGWNNEHNSCSCSYLSCSCTGTSLLHVYWESPSKCFALLPILWLPTESVAMFGRSGWQIWSAAMHLLVARCQIYI